MSKSGKGNIAKGNINKQVKSASLEVDCLQFLDLLLLASDWRIFLLGFGSQELADGLEDYVVGNVGEEGR